MKIPCLSFGMSFQPLVAAALFVLSTALTVSAAVYAQSAETLALAATPSRHLLQQPEVVRLPLSIGGKAVEVAAHLYKPAGAGPFALVLYAHGRAGTPAERAAMKFPVGVSHANYWLQKGVALLAPVRPGYGETGGEDRENSGIRWNGAACSGAIDIPAMAARARQTQAAALAWALAQPWVRTDRVLLEGQSVGGMTTIALSALNPAGVVGAVNFAGGTGGNPHTSPGRSCHPELLTQLYGELGKQTKMPNLWLYASNDNYWGAEMPVVWHDAFKAGGSDSGWLQTGPVEGADGHQLVNRGAGMWRSTLDAFVDKTGLLRP